ncbi:glycosyltransferase [candidate division KSB1 bacterium]|nr:glycosyltransferase family 2 protein [candidate division KSB1 bacterium]RQW05383.1 MAG: glycosyltransferase [candidate division KSB1 bacterium]
MAGEGQVDISIVVPLLNEAGSVLELYEGIKAVLQDLGKDFEVIFVDDGSTDGSAFLIKELNEKDSRAKLIEFRKNYGKAAALAAGFNMAQGHVVITMDADLQDDPKEIPNLLNKLNEGYDLVSGWKKVRHDPFLKRVSSKVYNLFTSLFSGIRLHDFNCGLKAYRSEVVKTMNVYGELHRYLPVIAHRNGYRVTEIPVRHHARKYGRSKYGVARFTRGAFDLMTITFLTRYKKRPLHLFGSWGLISTFAGLVILAVLAVQKIFFAAHLSRRPLLFLGLLLVIVGMQSFSIGLLGEMITESRAESDNYLVKKYTGWD